MKAFVLIAALAAAQAALASDPSEVVERLPHGFSKQAAKLRATALAPLTEGETIHLAQDYLKLGRGNADVALVNIGASLLDPLARKSNAPAAALLTLAMCKSYAHDFTNALTLLHRAASSAETRREAELQSVSILVTLGRHTEARAIFSRNPSLFSDARGITLLALLSSNTGQLESSYDLLKSHHESWINDTPSETRWRLGILAEMAERLGKPDEAEHRHRAALLLPEADLYTETAWLNFLLANHRNEEALSFIEGSVFREKLRLWHAAILPNATDIQNLEQEFARTLAHQREHAFFLLRVKNQPAKALDVALENWTVQKEAFDLRLVIESALAAHQPERAREAIAWMHESKFQDARLATLINEGAL